MSKNEVAFLESRLFPVIQSYLKSFQKALIGWKKADRPKKLLLYWTIVHKPGLYSFNFKTRSLRLIKTRKPVVLNRNVL